MGDFEGLAMVYGDRVPDLPASPGDNRSETPSAKEDLPKEDSSAHKLPIKHLGNGSLADILLRSYVGCFCLSLKLSLNRFRRAIRPIGRSQRRFGLF